MRIKSRFNLLAAALIPLLVLGLAAAPAGSDPGAPPDDKGIDAVAKAVSAAVVKVEARNGMRKVAMGVVMDKDGYIVTTALISPKEETITVITADGKRFKADFVGLDSQTRLAVLKTKDKLPSAVTLGKSEGLAPGAWVGVISLSPENTPAVSQGIISSVAPDWLRLNVWIVRGASGSPVVNKDGQMIGLLRGAYYEDNPVLLEFREQQVVGSGYAFSRAEAPASGMAQAIPIDIVKDVYGQIRDKGKVERGWLGVSVRDSEDGQAVIAGVEPDSPASLAKLKEGDIILKLEGKEITGPEVLTSEVRLRKPGRDVTLQINRDGKTLDVKVKLGEYSGKDARLEIERAFPQLFNLPVPTPRAPQAPRPPVTPRVAPAPTQPAPPKFVWEKRRFMGFYLQETTKELGEYFGLKDGIGLLVTRFTENSPAQKAGLKVGDVIFKADGKNVQSVSELSGILQGKKKGDKVKIEFMRDKKALSADVEVGEEENQGLFGFYFNDSDGSEGLQSLIQRFDDSTFWSKEANKQAADQLKKQLDVLKTKPRNGKILRYRYSGNVYRI